MLFQAKLGQPLKWTKTRKDHRQVTVSGLWVGAAVSARTVPSRAPQSKLLDSSDSSYHASPSEAGAVVQGKHRFETG